MIQVKAMYTHDRHILEYGLVTWYELSWSILTMYRCFSNHCNWWRSLPDFLWKMIMCFLDPGCDSQGLSCIYIYTYIYICSNRHSNIQYQQVSMCIQKSVFTMHTSFYFHEAHVEPHVELWYLCVGSIDRWCFVNISRLLIWAWRVLLNEIPCHPYGTPQKKHLGVGSRCMLRFVVFKVWCSF